MEFQQSMYLGVPIFQCFLYLPYLDAFFPTTITTWDELGLSTYCYRMDYQLLLPPTYLGVCIYFYFNC